MIIDTTHWQWPQYLLLWGAFLDFFGALLLMKISPKKNWLVQWFADNSWVFLIVIAGGFFK